MQEMRDLQRKSGLHLSNLLLGGKQDNILCLFLCVGMMGFLLGIFFIEFLKNIFKKCLIFLQCIPKLVLFLGVFFSLQLYFLKISTLLERLVVMRLLEKFQKTFQQRQIMTLELSTVAMYSTNIDFNIFIFI